MLGPAAATAPHVSNARSNSGRWNSSCPQSRPFQRHPLRFSKDSSRERSFINKSFARLNGNSNSPRSPFLRSIITVTLPSSSTVSSIGSIAGLPGLARVPYLLHTHLSMHGTGRKSAPSTVCYSCQICAPREALGQATGMSRSLYACGRGCQ